MPNPIQILRSAVTGNRPPAGKLPGEPYVNWADRQFGVVDAAGATQDLIGVRHWSAEAAYAKDDHVIQDGRMYSARDAIAPGPFVEARWYKLTRKRLYAPLQLYVDAATGNDTTGDGSQTAPWATVYQAGAWISQELDLNGYTVIIRVAAGDYDFANFYALVGGGVVLIWGAGKDVTNIRKFNIRLNSETSVSLNAMTLKPIAGDNAIFLESAKAQIEGATGFAIDLTLTTNVAYSTANSTLRTYGPIEIRTNGVSGSYCFNSERGCEWIDTAAWTITGAAPNTHAAFVRLSKGTYQGSPTADFSGPALGKRFELVNDSHADTIATIVRDGDFGLTVTSGDGSTRRVDLFPGDQPGTWDTSSWYDGVQGGGTYDDPLGNATFYVEVTGSNTTGDGSQANPWASLRAAYDHLALYREISGVVTINLGPGDHAYATLFWPGLTGNGSVDILGAGSAASSVDGIFIHGPDSGPTPQIYVNKLTIKTTYNASYQVAAYNGAHVVLGDRMAQVNDVVIDNAIGLIKPPIHADARGFISTVNSPGGVIELRQNGCTYSAVIELSSGGRYEERANWTLSGTPDTCTLGFLSATGDSNYVASGFAPILKGDERAVDSDSGVTPLIFTGPITGPKFNLADQSSVWTNGKQGAAAAAPGGLEFLPGTLPGVLDASSSYDGVNGGPKPRRKADWGDAFYVDAAGSDANDGMSAATPWATLQRAADFFSNEYDFGIVGVTVTIGVGTFVGPKMFNLRGGGGSGGKVVFSGAGVDQTIVTENNAGACFYAENFHGRIVIEKMTVRTSPGYAVFLVDECLLYLYGPLALETAVIGGASESYIYVSGAIELRMTGANVGNAFGIKSHSHFLDAAAWTLSGATPNNYANWVSLDEVSYYQHAGATYAGSTTGKRFSGTHGSIFNSGGRGVDLLPGDAPGTLDGSSFYDGVQGGDAHLPLTGGTLTGPLKIDAPYSAAEPSALEVYGLAGNFAQVSVGAPTGAAIIAGTVGQGAATQRRWAIYIKDNTPEAGGNSGSDFRLERYDDVGGFIDYPIEITRATGLVTIPNLAGQRQILTAPLTLTVDAAGSDTAGDGSATAPWATLAKVADYIRTRLDLNFQTVTVSIGAGTFAGADFYAKDGTVKLVGAGKDITFVNTSMKAYGFFTFMASNMTVMIVATNAFRAEDGCTLILDGGIALDASVSTYDPICIRYFSAGVIRSDIELRQTGVAFTGGFISVGPYSTLSDQAQWTLTGTPNTYSSWLALYDHSVGLLLYSTYTGTPSASAAYSLRTMSYLDTKGMVLPGDLPTSTCDNSSFVDGVQGNHREVLTANREYFIETTGSDANTGSQMVSGKPGDTDRDEITGRAYGPWATLRKAFDYIEKNLDLAGFTITLNLGAGVFAGSWCGALTGGGALYVKGAGSALTTIGDAATGTCVQVYGNNTEKRTAIYVNRVTLIPGNSYYAIYVIDGGFVRIGDAFWVDPIDLVFSTINTPQYLVFLTGALSQFVTGDGAISVLMNGVAFYSMFLIQGGALLDVDQAVWTYTGTPDTMTDVFIKLDDSEYVWRSPCAHVGSVIGKRFDLKHWSMVRKTGGTLPVDLFPGTIPGTWDGSSFYDGVPGSPPLHRKLLTAALDLYVDATLGNDINDGAIGAPFATLQRAADYIWRELDMNQQTVNVRCAAGTYEGVTFKGMTNPGLVYLRGAGVDVTIIQAVAAWNTLAVEQGWLYVRDGWTIKPQVSAGPAAVAVGAGTTLSLAGPIAFEALTNYDCIVAVFGGAQCVSSGAIELRQSGVANPYSVVGVSGKSAYTEQAQWTLSGAGSFASFLSMDGFSFYSRWSGGGAGSYTGTMTGKKFAISNGSIANTSGIGIDLFPGDVAGTVDPTSFYDGVIGTAPYVMFDQPPSMRKEAPPDDEAELAVAAPPPVARSPSRTPPRTPSRR